MTGHLQARSGVEVFVSEQSAESGAKKKRVFVRKAKAIEVAEEAGGMANEPASEPPSLDEPVGADVGAEAELQGHDSPSHNVAVRPVEPQVVVVQAEAGAVVDLARIERVAGRVQQVVRRTVLQGAVEVGNILIEEFNLDGDDDGERLESFRILEERLDMSKSRLHRFVGLAKASKNLPTEQLEALSVSTFRALLPVKDVELQRDLAQEIIDEGLTSRQAEEMVRARTGKSKSQKPLRDFGTTTQRNQVVGKQRQAVQELPELEPHIDSESTPMAGESTPATVAETPAPLPRWMAVQGGVNTLCALLGHPPGGSKDREKRNAQVLQWRGEFRKAWDVLPVGRPFTLNFIPAGPEPWPAAFGRGALALVAALRWTYADGDIDADEEGVLRGCHHELRTAIEQFLQEQADVKGRAILDEKAGEASRFTRAGDDSDP